MVIRTSKRSAKGRSARWGVSVNSLSCNDRGRACARKSIGGERQVEAQGVVHDLNVFLDGAVPGARPPIRDCRRPPSTRLEGTGRLRDAFLSLACEDANEMRAQVSVQTSRRKLPHVPTRSVVQPSASTSCLDFVIPKLWKRTSREASEVFDAKGLSRGPSISIACEQRGARTSF